MSVGLDDQVETSLVSTPGIDSKSPNFCKRYDLSCAFVKRLVVSVVFPDNRDTEEECDVCEYKTEP